MSESIRTSITINKRILKMVKEYNLNMSKIVQEALEKRIKIEQKKHKKKLSFQKIKNIYFKKGFETGRIGASKYSKYELKIAISTINGEGRYSIWNIDDRVDDIFEKNFDYKIFDEHFYKYETGWVLRDDTLIQDPEYSWFITKKPIDLLVEDARGEALFEYKNGFAMGLCNIQKPIEATKTDPIISKVEINIQNKKLTKKQAIEITSKEVSVSLNNRNTIFSNQNNANDLWWFEPTYEKLESNFFLILHDKKDQVLFLFNISDPKEITKNKFRDRPEKGRVSIIIDSNDTFNFMDKSSGSSNINFSKYLIKTIKY